MATFDQIRQIATDPFFQGRVGYATMVAAINVFSEDPATSNHAQRLAFAENVIKGTGYNIGAVTLAVLSNSTIATEATMTPTPGANVPDSDIQFAVNSLWNAFSSGTVV